ncbi:MAG TPA: putative selenate reductase subunit YgfK, partial [Verrucomicrobiae bacterium]|nr:putative selenate reductase subunit YgfK [Verrucomicrobiae bacterium]
ETFDKMGYDYIVLKEQSFTHDLQFADGVAMLHRLRAFSKEQSREFGVKLSNTLPVRITQDELPGDEMYMSGRALYPLTINLALKLAEEFAGDLKISYSGGADIFNLADIFATGIRPITLATTLLKPGGYTRLRQIAESLEPSLDNTESGKLDLTKLRDLAEKAIKDANYLKQKKPGTSRKLSRNLSITDCFVAPCNKGCPIEQDIPQYVRLVGEGKHLDALKVIMDKNPLPFITGTICNHKCMSKCTRLDYEQAVQIRALKLEAAQNGYEAYLANRGFGPTGQVGKGTKVAVIGAGPSGLAAAYFLAKASLDVTVFDKRAQAGGTVQYVIPDFRISREAIENDVELVRRAGVKFEFGVPAKFSVTELMAKGFKYVYLAIGAGKNNSIALAGDIQNVKGAIPFLEEFNRSKEIRLGKNVAVIGGGNSAMDAARAALKVDGVEKVYVVYRRTKEFMPADAEELTLALENGVILKELLAPAALQNGQLRCEQMQLGEPDASGRRSPRGTGIWIEIPADTVLSAIGEQVDYELLQSNGIEVDGRGKIRVNPDTLETNLTNVFIGGDALYGPATVVEGIAHAAKACEEIAARENAARERITLAECSLSEQRAAEIVGRKGLLKHVYEAEAEAQRCLECNAVCNVCTEVCPNRANIPLGVSAPGLCNYNQILHVDGMCNECGNCATFCPNTGAPYKDKLTLFWSEADFANSTNPGFLLLKDGEEPLFKIRLNDSTCKVKFDTTGTPCVPIDEGVAAMIWSCFTKYKHIF